MKILRNRLLFIVFLGLAFTVFSQETPRVLSVADTTRIRIGEQFNYQIVVENAEKGVQFIPLQLDSLRHIEIVDSLGIDTLKKKLIQKYRLTSFDSGRYVIPRQPVLIWDQPYYTDSIPIDVATVAVDTTKQKMYPIKAIYSEPYTFADFKSYLWWILGILLLLAIIIYFITRKKKTQEEIIAKLPPYEQALERLKELDSKQLWQKNMVKEYYIELTDIVRSYIERELKIPALESTTDELMETITDFNSSSKLNIPAETIGKLNKLLTEADLVKFAKFKPLSNEIELHRNDAGVVVDGIKSSIPQEVVTGSVSQAGSNNSKQGTWQGASNNKTAENKTSNTTRIIIVTAVVLGMLVMVALGIFIYKGVAMAKDKVMGHDTKELVDGDWFTSSYGYPAVTMETPKVLNPQKIEVPGNLRGYIDQMATFNYGSLVAGFFINVVTTGYTSQVTSFDYETAVQSSLQNIESQGISLYDITKEKAILKGHEVMKISALYKQENPLTKKEEEHRVLLVISGNAKGSDVIIIGYKAKDGKSQEISDRIINSIQFEDEAVE